MVALVVLSCVNTKMGQTGFNQRFQSPTVRAHQLALYHQYKIVYGMCCHFLLESCNAVTFYYRVSLSSTNKMSNMLFGNKLCFIKKTSVMKLL